MACYRPRKIIEACLKVNNISWSKQKSIRKDHMYQVTKARALHIHRTTRFYSKVKRRKISMKRREIYLMRIFIELASLNRPLFLSMILTWLLLIILLFCIYVTRTIIETTWVLGLCGLRVFVVYYHCLMCACIDVCLFCFWLILSAPFHLRCSLLNVCHC